MRPSETQMSLAWAQIPTLQTEQATFPDRAASYPRLRYMGGKHKLLPWIWETLKDIEFQSALDVFSGTGAVAYLMKSMGKRVITNDFLKFARDLSAASVANSRVTLTDAEVDTICTSVSRKKGFIERTFDGIFFTTTDLRFLDQAWANLRDMTLDDGAREIALASLTRACLKRQPRGVFTVTGMQYDDGRRDLHMSIEEHFRESVAVFNDLVFDNGESHIALRGDAFDAPASTDLVYMDPPYVPRADDNCYVKRYHFLEGLASNWQEPGTEIMESSRVKKIAKRFTPFSYRRTAVEAFSTIFHRFHDQTIVLSYSSNGYPDLQTLLDLLRREKRDVNVVKREHRYHFGTHKGVASERKLVDEYLIIGRG
jgi:adenine-specific DNA-methyltransferase